MITTSAGGEWLLGLGLRSIAILISVWLIATVLRKSSAATLYRIWFFGLMSCLVLLPIGSILPQWRLGVLPPSTAESFAANFALRDHPSFDAMPQTPQPNLPLMLAPPLNAVDHVTRESDLAIQRPDNPSPAINESSAVSGSSISPIVWAISAWVIGVVFVAIRYASHWATARALRSSSDVCDDPLWQEMVTHCANELNLKRLISLAFSSDQISPMVIGIIRPVVLLPESAVHWNQERRRLVLMHELAHIHRNDLLSQLLASIVCAIYWFNPLVWMANRRLHMLREIACDDTVVAQTDQPGLYAEVLLSVAMAARTRSVAGAIAMARSNNVRSRIVCILDSARARNPLNRRSAIVLALLAAGLGILIGTGSLTSIAQESQPQVAKEEPNAEAVHKPAEQTEVIPTKTMTVRVLDDSGKPLSGADVHVSVWEFGKRSEYGNRDFQTDDQGEASFPIPKRIQILRLWARKPNYVPLFVNFQQGTHDDGERIPGSYEFRLERGSKLSGRVVDSDGKSITGAKVQVSYYCEEKNWGPNPLPQYDRWLAEDDNAVATDENGRWQIDNAVGPSANFKGEFQLMVNHPDYAGDTQWGELQSKQNITTAQLRDGTAVMTLSGGARLSGKITDAQGNPVTKGLVTWSRDPYSSDGVNETPIDATGRFETLRLKIGAYPITILAPGFAPQQKQVVLLNGELQEDFSLQPGHKLKLRIVDPDGKPIQNAYVTVGKWRNSRSIYNHIHPNVLASEIPIKADEQGVYSWDWAPEDAVEYFVSAKGYDTLETTLVASSGVRDITLIPQSAIFGRVTDKATGKPIPKFRTIIVHSRGSDDVSTEYMWAKYVQDDQGLYRYVIDTSGQDGLQYRIRIEADGYRSALGTKILSIGGSSLEENFELQSAAPQTVSVRNVDGRAATKFQVAISTPTSTAYFDPDRGGLVGNHFDINDSDRFTLAASFEPNLIRVYNDEGFAEHLQQPGEPIPVIQLQAWAQLKGRLMQGDQPVAKCGLSFMPSREYEQNGIIFNEGYTAATDADGNFQINKLPPLTGHVNSYLGPWHESPLASSESMPVRLQPGKTTEVELGGPGATIAGKVVATGRSNDASTKQWSINYLIRRDAGMLQTKSASGLKGFDPSGPIAPKWTSRIGFYGWLTSHQNYSFTLAKDGGLKIYGVDPGRYELIIQLYEQPVGSLIETVGAKVIPLTITAEQVVAGHIDLGDIEIACHQGPRAGSDMREYQFRGANGRLTRIADTGERYVLLHVWSGASGLNKESIPQLEAAANKYSGEQITFTGMNADTFDLVEQLAITTLPAYYLIGPDGKLIASTEFWQIMEEALKTQFKH